jgi:hypothetical protein
LATTRFALVLGVFADLRAGFAFAGFTARFAVVASFAELAAFAGTLEAGVGGIADFAAAGFMELSFFLAINLQTISGDLPGVNRLLESRQKERASILAPVFGA